MITCTFNIYSFIMIKSHDIIISLIVITFYNSCFRNVSNIKFNFLFVYKIMYDNSIYHFETNSF